MKPGDITDTLADEILALVQTGVGVPRAIQQKTGVSRRTSFRWRDRSIDAWDEGERTPFARMGHDCAVEVARQLGELESMAKRAIRADDPDFADLSSKDRLHHIRWALKTLLREEYGDEVSVKLQGAVETLLSQVEPHMPRQSYADLLSALATVAGLDFGAGDEVDDDEAEDAHPLY